MCLVVPETMDVLRHRLLNFNVSAQAEAERKDFLTEKKQLLNFSVAQPPVDGDQSMFMSSKKQRPMRVRHGEHSSFKMFYACTAIQRHLSQNT